jgi:hypothetical protein
MVLDEPLAQHLAALKVGNGYLLKKKHTRSNLRFQFLQSTFSFLWSLRETINDESHVINELFIHTAASRSFCCSSLSSSFKSSRQAPSYQREQLTTKSSRM